MKRLLIIILFIVLVALPCLGAFTRSIDDRSTYRHAYRWTGKPKDLLYDWAQEVEDRLTGATAVEYLMFTGQTADQGSTEGTLYYDTTANVLKYHNGTAFQTIAAESGSQSLDTAYNNGVAITVDNGAVALTATDDADNTVFQVVQSDTATALGIDINNSGSGNSIDIQGTSGNDIQGTGDTWEISTAGLITTSGGITVESGGDVTFDDTYDVQWDSSEDTLVVKDNAVLGFGNTGAAPDVEISWDADSLNIIAQAVDQPLEIGATGAGAAKGFDITYFFETAGQFRTDYDGDFINLTDDMDLRFGTGASSDGDFQISSNSSNLLTIGQIVSGTGTIAIGVDNKGIDTTFYGEATGDYMMWDQSEDELVFEDAIIVLNEGSDMVFQDSGDATDWTVDCDTALRLDFTPNTTADDGIFSIGNANNTADLYIYGKEVSEGIFFDASAAVWNFGFASDSGIDMVCWGDTASQRAWWDCSGDEWFFGDDAEGVDVTFNGDNTGNYIKWDENLDTLVGVGGHIKLDDDANIYLGTGTNVTTADGDFTVNFTDGTPGYLTITATTAEDVLQLGDGTIATDVLIQNTTTAGADIFWDDSGELWKFGADNIGVDVGFYGDTTGDFILFDEDADELVVEDIKINIMDDTLLTFGDGDDVTMNYDEDGDNDLQVTGAVTLEGTLTTAGTVQPDVPISDAAGYTMLAANSGKVHIIGDLGQNCTIDLPAEVDGMNFEFWYCATAAEVHDHTIDSEAAANYFIGGVLFHDTDDSSITKVASDNDSNSKLTLNNLEVGTWIKMTCEGTKWYITGYVVSDTAPAFADQ